jgi:hypothetical protein
MANKTGFFLRSLCLSMQAYARARTLPNTVLEGLPGDCAGLLLMLGLPILLYVSAAFSYTAIEY